MSWCKFAISPWTTIRGCMFFDLLELLLGLLLAFFGQSPHFQFAGMVVLLFRADTFSREDEVTRLENGPGSRSQRLTETLCNVVGCHSAVLMRGCHRDLTGSDEQLFPVLGCGTHTFVFELLANGHCILSPRLKMLLGTLFGGQVVRCCNHDSRNRIWDIELDALRRTKCRHLYIRMDVHTSTSGAK